MDNLLIIILTTILIATVLNTFLRRFEIPTVIGYILSGAIISQIFHLTHEKHNESLHQLAEFGIVFLMFTIGLEFSIRHLKKMKKEVFLFGALQMLITGNLFGAFAHEVLGLELKSAIIIGFSLALSSTAIVLKMLTERGELHSGYGRATLGILLFQDIAVIPILLMLTIFTTHQKSVANMLLWTFIDASILLLIIFVIGKYILDRFLSWTLSSDTEEIFLVATLMIVIGASYFAHIMGFSYSLGAFLAGMTLSETKFKYRIESDLITFRDIFLGIFFVTIGMQIEPSIVIEHIFLIVALLIGIMVAKGIIIYAVLSRFLQNRTAFKSALALMQVGEFALAIFALATQGNLIAQDLDQILIVTVTLSMIVTPFIITRIKIFADKIFDFKNDEYPPINSSGYSEHILILGYGILGQKLAKKLRELSIPYLVIEHDYKLVEEARKNGEPIMLANASNHNVLKHAGIDKALAVVVAIENPVKTRMVVDSITSIVPDVKTIVVVRNKSHQEIIETFNVDCIINTSDIVSSAILDELFKCSID